MIFFVWHQNYDVKFGALWFLCLFFKCVYVLEGKKLRERDRVYYIGDRCHI